MQRVKKGARFLDQLRPGWANKIKITKLDMSDSYLCVMGQIDESLFSKNSEFLWNHGFDIRWLESTTYGDLQRAWLIEIRKRRRKTRETVQQMPKTVRARKSV